MRVERQAWEKEEGVFLCRGQTTRKGMENERRGEKWEPEEAVCFNGKKPA